MSYSSDHDDSEHVDWSEEDSLVSFKTMSDSEHSYYENLERKWEKTMSDSEHAYDENLERQWEEGQSVQEFFEGPQGSVRFSETEHRKPKQLPSSSDPMGGHQSRMGQPKKREKYENPEKHEKRAEPKERVFDSCRNVKK